MSKDKVCHDCGAIEGQYHLLGCDMERCPFCGGQLISCYCRYELLNIDISPGTWAYKNGLTEEQSVKFEKMLEAEGRIPWIQIPNLCALCGKVFPDLFNDDEWRTYVIPPLQSKVLCESCYDRQVELFPEGWRNARKR